MTGPLVASTSALLKPSPWVVKRMQLLDVDGDDLPRADEVEKVGIEEGRTAPIGAALQHQREPHLRDRLLDSPEVEHVLPDRMAEPGHSGEVLWLTDQVHKKYGAQGARVGGCIDPVEERPHGGQAQYRRGNTKAAARASLTVIKLMPR